MWEIKETSPTNDLQHGHTVVGTTPVPIMPVYVKLIRGIMVRAPGPNDLFPNTDIVFIGRKKVTADHATGTGGFPLLPGGSVELPVEDAHEIYAVSGSEGQDISWMGV